MKERLKRLVRWWVLVPGFALVASAAGCPAGQPAIFLDNSAGVVTVQECINGENILLWTTPRFADAEVPAGTINGKNALFILSHIPTNAPLLTLNGLVLKTGNDYTVKANALTFTGKAIPAPGDLVQAWYRY